MAEHASKAKIAHSTQVLRGNGDGPPETFSQIHEVTTAEPPDEQAEDVEVTHLESPNRTKEYIAGMIEAGEVTFTCNWNPDEYADHAQLRADKVAGDNHNWRIVLPGAMETIQFPGYVKGLKVNVSGPNDPITADVTIKLAGATSVS